jgi:hypothetical protein
MDEAFPIVRAAPGGKTIRVAFLSFDFGEYSVRLANALAERTSVLLLLNEALAAPFIADLDARVTYQPVPRVRYRQGSMGFNIGLQFEHRFPIVLTVHDAQPHIGDKLSRKTPYCFWKLGFHRADQIIAHSHYVNDMVRVSSAYRPKSSM